MGRTGAGKSSLVQALFRMHEAERGCVHVSGRDISTLPLSTLRSKVRRRVTGRSRAWDAGANAAHRGHWCSLPRG